MLCAIWIQTMKGVRFSDKKICIVGIFTTGAIRNSFEHWKMQFLVTSGFTVFGFQNCPEIIVYL